MLQRCPLMMTHDFSSDRDAGRKWTVNRHQTNHGAVCLPAAARLNHSFLLTWWIYDVWSAAQGSLKLPSYYWSHLFNWLMHISQFKVHSFQRNVLHECIYTWFDWLRPKIISCTGGWISCPIKEKNLNNPQVCYMLYGLRKNFILGNCWNIYALYSVTSMHI